MVTTHEVEQRLRHTMHAMADSAEPADLWPDLTARLAAVPTPARPPEVPVTPRRGIRRPVVAFAVAFTMVIATLGVGIVLHPFDATEPGEVARVVSRDDLAYIPTYLPPGAPSLNGSLSFETEPRHPVPRLALLQWADATETRAAAGLSVWESMTGDSPHDAYGEPEADGLWVVDLIGTEPSAEFHVVGQRDDGSVFTAIGTGTDVHPVDSGLVRDLALAVRDGAPLPAELEEWVDVTPASIEPLVPEPVWYFNSAKPESHITGRIGPDVFDPRIELVKGPERCEMVAVRAIPAARCWRENSGTLTWQIADGVAAALSSYKYSADELMAVAESMVLMSPDDPRFPPEE